MRLVTPWKYNIVAPLIPDRFKNVVREKVLVHSVKHDLFPVPEKDIFPRFIHEGDTVIDIGANIGAYATKFSLLAGEGGRVHAFEPVTPTYTILRKSTAHLSNVTTYKLALSDHEGPEWIRLLRADETVGEISLFRSTLEPIWLGDSTREVTEEVTLRTLDSLDIQHPALIKCDAEGHDWHVIQGAHETTKKFKPVWMVEIMVPLDDSPIPQYFKSLDYGCFIPIKDTIRRVAPNELSCTQNYFFVPEERK
jgi:FkbM family methyltransferase